jgi:hypothetical protein
MRCKTAFQKCEMRGAGEMSASRYVVGMANHESELGDVEPSSGPGYLPIRGSEQ